VALTLATHPSGESPVGVKNRPHRCGLLVRFFHELTFAIVRSGYYSLIIH